MTNDPTTPLFPPLDPVSPDPVLPGEEPVNQPVTIPSESDGPPEVLPLVPPEDEPESPAHAPE